MTKSTSIAGISFAIYINNTQTTKTSQQQKYKKIFHSFSIVFSLHHNNLCNIKIFDDKPTRYMQLHFHNQCIKISITWCTSLHKCAYTNCAMILYFSFVLMSMVFAGMYKHTKGCIKSYGPQQSLIKFVTFYWLNHATTLFLDGVTIKEERCGVSLPHLANRSRGVATRHRGDWCNMCKNIITHQLWW